MITVLQSDGENMPDILAGIGSSAALMCSTIPWNGPIATVRVGRVNNDIIINPTREEIEKSDLEMVVSGNKELECNFSSNQTFSRNLKFINTFLLIRNVENLQ